MKDYIMPLNIQLFAEIDDDSAANTTLVDTDADSDQDEDVTFTDGVSTSETDATGESVKKTSKKQSTKDYSERLKTDRENIRRELEEQKKADLDALAKGRGFTNWEELEEFDKSEQIKSLGVEDVDGFQSLLDTMIDKNPKIKQAEAIIAEQQKKERDRMLEAQVKEIGQLDDSIKTITDLLTHPRYDEIIEKVKTVGSLSDAYKLVNFDLLTGKQKDAAVQDVYNNMNSKSHLRTTVGGASKDVIVPTETMTMYKKTFPTWTEEQIKSHYAKFTGGEK